jgi:AraC-like DNA-binding protein
MEKFDLAEKYILDALEVAKNNNIVLYYSDIYESLSDLYYTMGKYKEAYDYTKISWAYQDSLLNIEIASEIEELNIKYETSQKEKQIAIQELTIINQKEDIKHKTQINRLIIAGLLLTLIFILILLILYVQKRKAYKVLVQQNIALANSETRIIIPQKKQTLDNKYSGSNLSENQKDEFLIKFRKLMEEDEIYLNRQICIENVAEMIGTNRNYLSQLINEKFAMNFNNYINEFRVHRARQLLINPEYANFTIEAIANEAGFHSKATFNNSFKKFAGVTPSFFKNNQ